jgi:hypothetical protein
VVKFLVYQLFHMPGIDNDTDRPDPDRHALDVDIDPDPEKLCESEPIQINNTV